MNELKMSDVATAEVARGNTNVQGAFQPTGRFVVEHWRNGERINEYHFHNAVTTEGKNYMLNVLFKAATQYSSWYLGLINNTGYTALAVGDAYTGINQAANGWAEFSSYTDTNNSGNATTRPSWGPGTASAATTTNATAAVFTITAAGTVKGLFACTGGSAQPKNDYAAGNYLYATALFSSGDVTVANGDQLKVTYTVTAT